MTRSQALVLAGHGSQHHPDSAAPLHAHAERIRELGAFDEVRTAFWKEEPSLRDVTATVASDAAYVVPVLTSEGYFADEVFPRELAVDGPADRPGDVVVHYTEPVGTHDAMTGVIEARVESAIHGPPTGVGVAVVGHGTERNARSARATRRHAERLRSSGRYAEVAALFLDEAPFVGDLVGHLHAEELVVVPLFVADGHHTTEDIPRAIGHPGIGESADVDGRLVHYTGAVGTEPDLADVIVERAVEAGATPRSGMAAPGLSDAGRAFLEWIDSARGGREWGELVVTGSDGGYALRHRADAGLPHEALGTIDGPVMLREHVRHDDGGRYRPLSGAPTLPTGWTVDGLDESGLVRAVRSVYPASVAHWHRERTGDLHVTDFHETAARQTGIYADVGELDRTTLSAATEAVCGDCVRRRCWAWGEDDELDASNGDGEIPCREACPFLLSAVQAFADAGSDAGGREDSETAVGALENPGNRYRVRYSRAVARRETVPASDTAGGAR